MNDKPDTKIDYISPLKRICMTIGQLPSSYIETMSYYEMLVWFVEYLRNTIIPTIDNNAAAVQELQTLFIELQDYVNDYFDNLDVQEEINNKIDAMITSGEFEDIIASYISKTAIIFDTVSDMKSSNALDDGMYAKTLGFRAIGDGGSALYKITDKGNTVANEMDLIAIGSDLIANFILERNEIRPEQIGAYTKTNSDSINFINRAIEIFPKNVVMDGTYYVSEAITLTTAQNVNISGHGTVISSDTYALILDGCGWCTVSGLKFTGTNGLKLTGTTGASQYNKFNNLTFTGNNTIASNGVLIDAPNYYNTESAFNGCYFPFFNYGIHVVNPDNTHETSGHKFIDCSTENSTLGQYLQNADYFTFENCRHIESGSLKWKTEGTCKQLLIIGGVISNNSAGSIDFSENTSGLIVGRVRTGGIYFNQSSRPFMIVGGKIIPDYNTVSEDYAQLDSAGTIPGQNYGTLYGAGRCYNPQTTETILDTNYYGGRGKINTFVLYLGHGCSKTITIGTKSWTITNSSGVDKFYAFEWFLLSGWTIREVTRTLS